MRFGSLFSGVGGFDMGLEAVGMKCAWQVEVEPQAASVLRYRWPAVDLHADVRNVGRSNLAPVDLICGGFPCQDLSVAGKRAGLAGERSGLFHEFMRVVDELAPRWVLIENVPGLLSSNGGRDMGTVLGVLGRLGYGWAYRCLDTQYFGPPQRRLRVFIVGRAGGFCPPEVLLEPEGLPWNPAPRREAREGSAGRTQDGIGGAGGVADTLSVGANQTSGFRGEAVANALPTKYRGDPHEGTDTLVAHTLRSEGADASEDGTGRGTPLVVTPIDMRQVSRGEKLTNNRPGGSSGGPPGAGIGEPGDPAFSVTERTQVVAITNDVAPTLTVGGRDKGAGDSYESGGATAGNNPGVRNVFPVGFDQYNASLSGDVSATIAGTEFHNRRPAVLIAVPRRITPRECERLQGWPDDWTRWGRTPDGEVRELSDSARYRMAGNGVSKPPAEWIARRIMMADPTSTPSETNESKTRETA